MDINSFLLWNFRLYCAFGITVRIHWLLIFTIIVEIIIAIIKLGLIGLWLSPIIAFLVFSIILLHEYGHCIAARIMGGSTDTIILWPLGGLAMCSCPNTPRAEFWTSFGGPLVNIILLIVGYLIMWFNLIPSTGSVHFIYLHYFLGVALNINLMLLLFNLIPCYPLDGGQIFRAILWPMVGYQRAIFYTIRLALIISACLFIYALFTQNFVLTVIAALIFWQTWQIKQTGSLEAGSLYISGLSRPLSKEISNKPTIFKNWQTKREQKEAANKKVKDKERMERIDKILDKINIVGIDRLSKEERQFLDETSEHLKKNR